MFCDLKTVFTVWEFDGSLKMVGPVLHVLGFWFENGFSFGILVMLKMVMQL